jgi:hypothetical protein
LDSMIGRFGKVLLADREWQYSILCGVGARGVPLMGKLMRQYVI